MKPLTTKQEILDYAAETKSSFLRKEAMRCFETILYDDLVFPVVKLQSTLFVSSDRWTEFNSSGEVIKIRRYTVRKIKWGMV
jgi:hypothetical protein